jgi:hypothetical protein
MEFDELELNKEEDRNISIGNQRCNKKALEPRSSF